MDEVNSTTPTKNEEKGESKLEKLLLAVLFLAIIALLGFLASVIFFG